MITPDMHKAMKNVGNRYLLVNLVAERAREVAYEADEAEEELEEKSVKIAMYEIGEGTIVPDADLVKRCRTETGDVY